MGNRDDKILVELGKRGPLTPKIHVFQKLPVDLEVQGLPIPLHKGFPMLFLPVRVLETYITNPAMAMTPYRDGEPLYPLRGLYLVPIAPIILRILDIIIKYEDIHVMNKVKVAFPRKIVRLANGNSRHTISTVIPAT
jgi:hypothetical protein